MVARTADLSARALGLALDALGAELALRAAGEFLHEPDLAHRHEVARQAVGIRARHRQVIDAELERGVGQLPGCRRHLARGRDRGILRNELARALGSEPLRFGERERALGGMRGNRQQ